MAVAWGAKGMGLGFSAVKGTDTPQGREMDKPQLCRTSISPVSQTPPGAEASCSPLGRALL